MGDQRFLVLRVVEKSMNKCISSRNGKELLLNETSIFDSSSLLEQACLYIYANLF